MVDLRVTTTSGTDGVLNESGIDELRASLRGALLRAGDEGYDESRSVWNAMIDRKPALIAGCVGAADVTGELLVRSKAMFKGGTHE